MKVLGIDTSGYSNAIGVCDGDEVLADCAFEARTDSLARIIDDIESVLKNTGLTLRDVEGLGVGLGPGSWTGIRIGVTIGKMLAYSTGKAVCGISTLEALSSGARRSGLICPIINAGTAGMVYAALYRVTNGSLSRLGDYYAGDLRGLANVIKEPVVITGKEAKRYAGQLGSLLSPPGEIVETLEGAPRGAEVAILAWRYLSSGSSNNVLSLTPLYLKESTARVFERPVVIGEL